MREIDSGGTLPDKSVIELDILKRVTDFRDGGAVAIKGMADTGTNWLHEFAKHQEWLRYANSIWPESPENPDTMTEEELTVLQETRVAHPSEEDALWETTLPPSLQGSS